MTVASWHVSTTFGHVTFSEEESMTFLKFSKPQILHVPAQLPSLGLEFPH